MGIYSDYINKQLSFSDLAIERKKYLKKVCDLRGREVVVYASDPSKQNAPTSIIPNDLLPFKDQLSNLTSKDVDIIIETPGGFAETVDDMVEYIHSKFDKVGIIIPGSAKSAGTIFTMAGDEILMGNTSSLGPIDAQVLNNGKRFSADAFLDGLEKIKAEVIEKGRLNPAYIPMLQTISPGEIQHFENAQNFSKVLVTKWLTKYKFKYWEKHCSSGLDVTEEEKLFRATEIASKLCKHSDWLTHARSIRREDLISMGLQIINYSDIPELEDAIERYFTLLRITFDKTAIYKIYETSNSQIYQSIDQSQVGANKPEGSIVAYVCPKCHQKFKIHLKFMDGAKDIQGSIPYPKNDIFKCKVCNTETDLSSLRMQIEAQTKQKVKL